MADHFDHEPFSHRGEKDDDLDSLFGDASDASDAEQQQQQQQSSPFTEAAAVVDPWRDARADCEPASSPLQHGPRAEAANPAAQLHLPEARARPVVAQLSLPAVPDPPGASLSRRGGHTSGDLVVSTQDSDRSLPAARPAAAPPSPSEEPLRDDAALEAELESLWESLTESQDQPVNAHTDSSSSNSSGSSGGSQENDAAQQDDTVIPMTRIPGFRYANSMTNTHFVMPRRVDQDQKLADQLVHFVTLNRATKLDVLYGHLELDTDEGKRLIAELRTLLKQQPLRRLVEKTNNNVSETKKKLVKIAFYLLVSEGWGPAWFGDGCRTAQSRTLFWPRDSTILLICFVMLLYKVYDNQRVAYQQRMRLMARQTGSAALASPPETPPPGQKEGGEEPPPPPPPPQQQQQQQQQQQGGPACFSSLAQHASATKKRKHAESVLGLADPNGNNNNNGGSSAVVELEIPANAKLTYHVYVKDKTDGSDLAPPATYRHTDAVMAHGSGGGAAFSSLRAAFEAAGHEEPILEIQTPFGRRTIASEQDWEHAVLTIYNVRRSGGVVEVDVFV